MAAKNKILRIPVEVWERTDLGWAEKILFAEIASYASRGRECWLSNQQIAGLLQCSEIRARVSLYKLIHLDLVRVETWDGRRRKLTGRLFENKQAECSKTNRQSVRKRTQTNIISSDIDISSDIKDNYIKEKKFDFLAALVSIGVAKATAQDWLAVRKTKRATNTRIAFEAIAKEIRKSGKPADDCIRCAVVHSWAGFRAAWLENKQADSTTTDRRENYVEAGLRAADALLGTNYLEQLHNGND
jgi:hypothetical protein